MPFAVDRHDLGLHAHVDIEPAAQKFGRGDGEVFPPLYLSADEIRQTAVRVRDVFSAFENDYLRVFVQSAQTSGAARAARDAADYHDFHKIPP